MNERKADRTYILTERQFLESVLAGATSKRYLPPGTLAEVQRAAVETAENGGVVLRIWVGQGERTVALEPQVLQPLLKGYAEELPGNVPTLAQVKGWLEADLLEVSQWVHALHARAHPIAGMVLPDLPEQPLVLFEVGTPQDDLPVPGSGAKKAKAGKKAKAARAAAPKVDFPSKKERKQRQHARAGAAAARSLIEDDGDTPENNARNMRAEMAEQEQAERARKPAKKAPREVHQPPPVEKRTTQATRRKLDAAAAARATDDVDAEVAAVEHAGGFPRGGGD